MMAAACRLEFRVIRSLRLSTLLYRVHLLFKFN
jgi:hypothetical protein